MSTQLFVLTPSNTASQAKAPKQAKEKQAVITGHEEEAGFVVEHLSRSAGLCKWTRKPNIWEYIKMTSTSLSGLCCEDYTDFSRVLLPAFVSRDLFILSTD